MRAIEKRSIYINRNQSDRWIHIFTRVLSDAFAMLPPLYAHICDSDSKSGQRSFALPEGTDGSKVSAEFKDGVLKLHLPKSEEAKPKSIEVKVN
jgi:Hsp20/alpha crystallin family